MCVPDIMKWGQNLRNCLDTRPWYGNRRIVSSHVLYWYTSYKDEKNILTITSMTGQNTNYKESVSENDI